MVEWKVGVKVIRFSPKSIIYPVYATEGSAGVDFFINHDLYIAPGCVEKAYTGIGLEIPTGYHLDIRPRSGMSIDYPLIIANSPGTIDSDYRGEILIIFRNVSNTETVRLEKGQRVAQGVLLRNYRMIFSDSDEEMVSITSRGTGGFGSTGK